MRRILKWTGIAFLIPVLLILILVILLYIPPVQNWAVKKVTDYASEQTGMAISVERVCLAFPLDLAVEGFKAYKPNDSIPSKTDTIAEVRRLVVDVQLLPLFSKQVEIDAFEFNTLKVNTAQFVPSARVRGNIERMYLESHGIDLSAESLRLNDVQLSGADVDVQLSDTVPEDTTSSETRWKIFADNITVDDTKATIHMPGDTLQVMAYMGEAVVKDCALDLFKGLYKVNAFTWKDGQLAYDDSFAARTAGLDYGHLSLSGVNIAVDSLSYCAPDLSLLLRECSFREKCGLHVTHLSGPVLMDSLRLRLPSLTLRTTESSLDARLDMALNTFDSQAPGVMELFADGSFGKQDLLHFMGGMPPAFLRQWPNYPLGVKANISGNMQNMNVAGIRIELPTAFKLNASGSLGNIINPDKLVADIDLKGNTYDIGFLTAMAGEGITIPHGISLDGNVSANGNGVYAADLSASEGTGQLLLDGTFDTRSMAYKAKIDAQALQVSHFMPGSGMGDFTGYVEAEGRGFDFMSPSASLNATAQVQKFSFGNYNLDAIDADITLNNGIAHAVIDSDNPLVKGMISFDALMNTDKLQATVSADLSHADLHGLNIVSQPFTLAMCCHLDLMSDLDKVYKVDGVIDDLTMRDAKKTYRPEGIVMDILTNPDTTYAKIDCADLHLKMKASGGYEHIISQIQDLADELTGQLNMKQLNHTALCKTLPTADIYLEAGSENIFSKALAREGVAYDYANILLTSSPHSGVNGDVRIERLIADSIQLDSVYFHIESDSTQCTYRAQVRNNKNNPQYVFNAIVDGSLFEKGAGASLRYYDAENRLGVRLGLEASVEENGMRLRVVDNDPILGYKNFSVNADNYIYMGSDMRISSRLQLLAADGMGVQLYSNDDNLEALQDLTLSLNKFDLEKILSVVPYMPRVTGMMNGDYHVIQTPDQFSVSSTMSVTDMTYERCPMGDLSTEFVYMPKDDGSHYVDAIIMNNDQLVGTLTGTYQSEGAGWLDARFDMSRMPLSLANGFIPDQIIGFRGYADGSVAVKGSLSAPQVDGEVFLDSSYLVSVPYGVELRFSNDPVRVVGSHLLLENFEMYGHNNNPLNIYGDINFSNLDDIKMNMRMRAENYQLINSKENVRSVAFGKAFVNFFGMINGSLSNLRMRGKLDVLGTTDMSYVLREGPLATDNQLDGLVEFVNLNDSTADVVVQPALSGLDMDLTLSVVQGARIMCYLNSDHSNYIDLMGGGDLRMQYNPSDNFVLTGKYLLNNGEMKYSLPIIPLKTFTIRDGSYIEFTGDPMNPKLNITATERVKATVGEEGGQGRPVDFDCGVMITRTLSDMGLEFTLDAPEDMSMHNELASMSVEQRGKLAVTMLTTGMYLADGNTSGFSMNGALSSFLQSEINNITGNALRTLDLSVGLDNTTDASGNMHTDYSFKFAKRFWNNRLKIVVGGKVSTGSEIENQNESFFDNVVFEYRLDNTANKYVTLFYDNNAYDWLEGTTQEYGVGFIWRRSLRHFKDIFRFKNETVQPRRDTVSVRRGPQPLPADTSEVKK